MRLLYPLFLLVLFVPAFTSAQLYSGVGTVNISGDSSLSLSFGSDQWVGRYQKGSQKVSFLVKTHALSLHADENARAFLKEILLMDTNPLLGLEIDMTRQYVEIAHLSGPTEMQTTIHIHFNDQVYTVTDMITVEVNEQQILVSASIDIPLSALKLYVPETDQSRYPTHINLAFSQAPLNRR